MRRGGLVVNDGSKRGGCVELGGEWRVTGGMEGGD